MNNAVCTWNLYDIIRITPHFHIKLKSFSITSPTLYTKLSSTCVEPQISHFTNFTACEELVQKKTSLLENANFAHGQFR